MSKLEELINQLCPDGVEYKTTKDVKIDSFWLMPATPNFINEGIPYITSKNIKDGVIDFEDVKYISVDDFQIISNNRKIEVNDLLITMIGTIGEAAFVQSELEFYGQNLYLIRLNEELVNRKYFYYFLTSPVIKNKLVSKKNASSQGYIKAGNLENLSIPLPPLPVQEEIVRILDKMTSLTAELTAELTLRQKQYEHYRDSLLNFDGKGEQDGVRWMKLGECCKVQAGGTPSKTKSEYWNNGTVKWLGSTVCKNKKTIDEVTGFITELGLAKSSAKIQEPKTTLIALVGATIGKVAFTTESVAINQNIAGVFPLDKNILSEDYLFYACKNLYPNFLDLGQGKLAMANLSFVRNLEIPIPSLEEQQRIVDILDRFDKLCNDLSEGLPAEIEARKKHYEYYRDKLLTFKEKEA